MAAYQHGWHYTTMIKERGWHTVLPATWTYNHFSLPSTTRAHFIVWGCQACDVMWCFTVPHWPVPWLPPMLIILRNSAFFSCPAGWMFFLRQTSVSWWKGWIVLQRAAVALWLTWLSVLSEEGISLPLWLPYSHNGISSAGFVSVVLDMQFGYFLLPLKSPY